MDSNNKGLTLEDVKDHLREQRSVPETGAARREVDSPDDFEHLGHDSSPLLEAAGDLKVVSPRDGAAGGINTVGGVGGGGGGGAAATAERKIADDKEHLSSFDPLLQHSANLTSALDHHHTSDKADLFETTPENMDSNLLEMGDNFPDRKEADAKLDKFLQEMSSFAPPKHQESPEFSDKDFLGDSGFAHRAATQDFMDSERAPFESPAKDTKKASSDQLERYSDSEPDDNSNNDDFKQFTTTAQVQDFPPPPPPVVTTASDKAHDELPRREPSPFSSVQALHSEFNDFKDFEPEEPPKKKEEFPPFLEPEEVIIPPAAKHVEKPKPVAPAEPEPPKDAPACKFSKEKEPEPIPEKVSIDAKTKKPTTIDAEAIFCRMGLDAWFNPERLNPKVESLIYWRDPKKSGPVFGGVLLVLLSLTYFSLISVVAYLSLLGLTGTISFRIYKNIVQAVQKTGDGHPFKELLEFDVALPQEKVKEISEVAVAHLNAGVVELRRLFLVEDLVDSIKFGVLLWTLTYLGAWFNGMTLIIIAWVALFTLPKVYETNKTQIDANLEIVRTKLADITSKVKAAIPIGKKAEEKKEQ